jgi:hypothetical protein
MIISLIFPTFKVRFFRKRKHKEINFPDRQESAFEIRLIFRPSALFYRELLSIQLGHPDDSTFRETSQSGPFKPHSSLSFVPDQQDLDPV